MQMKIHVPKVSPCQRDIAPVSPLRAQWLACLSSFDAQSFDALLAEGFDLEGATTDATSPFGSQTLLFDFESAWRNEPAKAEAQGRVFLMHLLKARNWWKGTTQSTYAVALVATLFPDDLELFEALLEAGFSFASPDGVMTKGYGSSKNVYEHLRRGQGSGAGFLLSHGCALPKDSPFTGMACQEFCSHPHKLGACLELAPSGSIDNPQWMLPLLAGAGMTQALMLLEDWPEAWTPESLQAALEEASKAQEVATGAFLLERRRQLFGTGGLGEDLAL